MTDTAELFGKEKISKVLLKLAPPVMLAQLIQALYNIMDSLFIGKYSAKSVIFDFFNNSDTTTSHKPSYPIWSALYHKSFTSHFC